MEKQTLHKISSGCFNRDQSRVDFAHALELVASEAVLGTKRLQLVARIGARGQDEHDWAERSRHLESVLEANNRRLHELVSHVVGDVDRHAALHSIHTEAPKKADALERRRTSAVAHGHLRVLGRLEVEPRPPHVAVGRNVGGKLRKDLGAHLGESHYVLPPCVCASGAWCVVRVGHGVWCEWGHHVCVSVSCGRARLA
jgi:hypothetical protein